MSTRYDLSFSKYASSMILKYFTAAHLSEQQACHSSIRQNLSPQITQTAFHFLSLISGFLSSTTAIGICLNKILDVVSFEGRDSRILCIWNPLRHSPLFFSSARIKSRFSSSDSNSFALTNPLHLLQAGYRLDFLFVPPRETGLI